MAGMEIWCRRMGRLKDAARERVSVQVAMDALSNGLGCVAGRLRLVSLLDRFVKKVVDAVNQRDRDLAGGKRFTPLTCPTRRSRGSRCTGRCQ